ncbi:MAG: glycosyltransferase [Streptosporangiaceae bacterium]
MRAAGDVAVIVPAKDEADRVGTTVSAACALPGVGVVVVVDDGSDDATGVLARGAGADVVRHDRCRGKGAAMTSGAEAVRALDRNDGRDSPRHLLFLDADLGESARRAAALVDPVRRGEADMTIARFPATRPRGGGHGAVVRLSREGIRRATGWEASEPLSGQRCLTRRAFDAARPLAGGFGVETALTIDLLRLGFRVREVEVDLVHRVTGSDLRAQLHRGRQLVDAARALAVRELPPFTLRWLRGPAERRDAAT